jgi:hypothetical protein
MNTANTRLALNHIKQIKDQNFNFGIYVALPVEEATDEELKLGILTCIDKTGKKSAKGKEYVEIYNNKLFMVNRELPCGSLRCFCGELWAKFAKEEYEKVMCPEEFSLQFLDLEFSDYFYEPRCYGKIDFHEVKLSHIIKFLETSLDLGYFQQPQNYDAYINCDWD